MHVLRTAVSMLGTLDPDADLNTPQANRRKAVQLVAQLPVITAYFHRIRSGKPPVAPSPKLNSAANFLYMLNGEPPNDEAAAPGSYGNVDSIGEEEMKIYLYFLASDQLEGRN